MPAGNGTRFRVQTVLAEETRALGLLRDRSVCMRHAWSSNDSLTVFVQQYRKSGASKGRLAAADLGFRSSA